MIPFPTLPWFELARFRRSRLTRVALVAVSVVPLLYGALYVWANIDPTHRLDHVQAAIVNQDEVVEATAPDGSTQPVAVGRQLAANLIGDDSDRNYDWELTDAGDAASGLSTGRYKAVLTIPRDLSKAATSTSGNPDEAVQGRLDLATNDGVNYINGTVAQSILGAARTAMNAQVTETYLDNVYLGFSDIKLAIDEAADGAGRLADGAGELADGTNDLRDGAQRLAQGNRQLATGARQLDDGAQTLAGGLGTLDRRTASLPTDTQRLADGARELSGGVGRLNTTVQQVTQVILDATAGADRDIDQLAAQVAQLADACEQNRPEGIDCSALRDAATRSGELKTWVTSVRGQAGEVRSGTQQLADGASRLADGNAALARNVPTLVGAIGRASAGATELASGTGRLATGAADAATGASTLANGTGQVAEGASSLASGAERLERGLNDGADDVPTYDEEQRENLAKTAATPITEAAERLNAVDSYGAALAPYFMALAMWVGAMAIYLLLKPLSDRAIASTAGSVRTAVAGLAPGVVLSAVQAALLVLVIETLVGVSAHDRLLTLAAALAGGVVFCAINQMFVAWFGGAGRFLALVFVCLQLTSADGTYPIETSPGFFGFLHDLLPMTYVLDLLRAGIAGGGHGVGADFAALAAFALLALSATVVAAHRRQRITLTRLHPTLVV